MKTNPAQRLFEESSQSIWYDNISREILENGELRRLISEWGVRGLTSNPTIFQSAISGSNIYDGAIRKLSSGGASIDQVFEELAVQDIGEAADLLRPVYDQSGGDDGFVSIEVSPLLAADTKGSIVEAERLYKKLARPNIMIKIPGTSEGIPAVHTLLSKGINVNITLLFSVENYTKVAETFCDALRQRSSQGGKIDKIRSVASFFVSRVDTIIDNSLNKLIEEKGKSDAAFKTKAESLIGRFGIANSKLAYRRFQEIFEGPRFADLKAKGAVPQRPLWASTSTKNPKYRDVIYVEELIGPSTVNTMPHVTLAAFADHGKIRQSLTENVKQAADLKQDLEQVGVRVEDLLMQLQVEGVQKFSDSFISLNAAIKNKMA